MGKKRVAKKTEEEIVKESDTVKNATTAKVRPSGKRKYVNGKVYIQATYNNTLMTVTDDKGNVITWMSAGSLGFKGPKKSTPFAASKVAGAVAEKLQKTGPFNVEVFVKGIGSGRDSAVRSLAGKGFNINLIKDITPIPHNGPRPRKARRV